MKASRNIEGIVTSSAFISTMEISGRKYIVKTESGPDAPGEIRTSVMHGGKTVSADSERFGAGGAGEGMSVKMQSFMLKHHQAAIKKLRKEKLREMKKPSDYLSELNSLIRKKNKAGALALLEDALDVYPDDPFLLSYHGCLDAIVNANYTEGVDTCRRAFRMLKEKVPFGEEFLSPVLYLNLGRAYLAAGNKRQAVRAFRKGLDIDSDNTELLWEMQELGMRKRPVVPILKRSNPINKYIGMLLHRLGARK